MSIVSMILLYMLINKRIELSVHKHPEPECHIGLKEYQKNGTGLVEEES